MKKCFRICLAACLLVAAVPARAEAVVLNELLANSLTFINPGRTNVSDWVELHNPSATPADLADMSLSDRSDTPRRWVFPAGTVLPGGNYLVVYFDGNFPATTNSAEFLNSGFGLKSSGDKVYLFDAPARGGGQLDFIAFGLQVPDLSLGRVAGTNSWTICAPTPGAANLPLALGDPAALRINEWMANPGVGDDWFELFNPNAQPMALGGLYLTDNLAKPTQYRVPDLSFVGTEEHAFALFSADNATNKGADHVNFRLNNGGEAIGLFDSRGTNIDAVIFGPQATGVSEGRFPDGSTNIIRLAENATPGKPNYLPIHDIVINEVLSHADDPFEDAIELYNQSSASVHLGGWYLSDNINKPKKFRIPYGTVIDPGGYAVFYRWQFQPTPGVPPSFGFSSAHGDSLYLFTAGDAGNLTGYRTGLSFPAAPNNVPFGRYMASTGPQFVLMSFITMGSPVVATDPESSITLWRLGKGASNAYPLIGSVVISEIMYHPPDFGTNDNQLDEYIELRNIVSTNVPLYDPISPTNHWSLRGAVDYTFPDNQFLPPGGALLVVSFDPATNTTQLAAFRAKYDVLPDVPIFGPYQGKLDNSADSIRLYSPDIPQFCLDPDFGFIPQILVDSVDYFDSTPWPLAADGTGLSLQRRGNEAFGNDPVNWYAGTPTPGASNGPPAGEPPVIATIKPQHSANAGENLVIAVGIIGATNLCQWRFNGSVIPEASNRTLTLSNVQPANAGVYSVLVSNPYGAASASCVVNVQSPPVLTQQPADQSLSPGNTAIFLVTAEGTPPFHYQWRKDGVQLAQATNSTVIVSNVQPADAGSYSVVVTTPAGDVTSAGAGLRLLSNQSPMIVVSPTRDFFTDTNSIFIDASYTLHVVASGEPPLHYQWRKNGADIPEATNAAFTMDSFQPSDTGNYLVEVSNDFGIVDSPGVNLGIAAIPVVTLPVEQVVTDVGNNVVFRPTVTGTPKLRYRWLFNGEEIRGEVCSVMTLNAHYGSGGSYRLKVINPFGTTVSSPVELIVRPRITGLSKVGDDIHLVFEGTPARNYAVQATTNFRTWDTITSVSNATGKATATHSKAPPGFSSYRLEQLP